MPNRRETLRLVRSHVHPDDLAAWDAHIASMRTQRRCEPFEFRYVRPDDGREVWLREESDILLDEHGVAVSQITTIRDVTLRRAGEERRQDLERQLFHSQKLEALGTLAGGIAHDLNNTLVPILALSQFSLELVPGNGPVRENLRAICTASERARDLVKRILAFSRKQEMRKGPIDLAALTRETLLMLRPTIPATIELGVHIAVVPLIIGDGGQFQQVMVNLLTNAAQAIGERAGHIKLVLETAPAAAGTNPRSIVLTIADTGCGINQANIRRIFEPFFTTKGVGEGTGLGLAMVHGIVGSHGGTIVVESTPGTGTTFVVTLPVGLPDERYGEYPLAAA
jgi:signal transduction histidine kinase